MKGKMIAVSKGILFAGFMSFATGCATTGTGDPRDPFEGFNRGVYSFNQTMDEVLFDPIGDVYRAITPEIVDKGVTNFFSNLNDIAVIVNGLLQFKINQA